MTAHSLETIEAVRQMKGNGMRTTEIAMTVGLTEQQVRGMCHHRGIRRAKSGWLGVSVSISAMEALHAEADRRDQSFGEFMRLLLRRIVDDRLFNAIIDDDK
jgi:hypothetical protein